MRRVPSSKSTSVTIWCCKKKYIRLRSKQQYGIAVISIKYTKKINFSVNNNKYVHSRVYVCQSVTIWVKIRSRTFCDTKWKYEKSMSMRSNRYERDEPAPRGKCLACLCVSWKIFSYVFSHVTLIALVVLYCVLGAWLFERLEKQNEEKVSTCWLYLYSFSYLFANSLLLWAHKNAECN